MTGWNLPPGCNDSDIPGNRPEDLAAEAFCAHMDKLVVECGGCFDGLSGGVIFSEIAWTAFVDKLMCLVGDAENEGYQERNGRPAIGTGHG